jgi:hypothetical protein
MLLLRLLTASDSTACVLFEPGSSHPSLCRRHHIEGLASRVSSCHATPIHLRKI